MDEPFFNFDSEEMDDEELYCESLLEELKKQQVWRENDSWGDCYIRWKDSRKPWDGLNPDSHD